MQVIYRQEVPDLKKSFNGDVMLIVAMLSPEQEQFLHEFYALCERYRRAGVVPCSHGQTELGYEVSLVLRSGSKKVPDGAGLIEFGLCTGTIKLPEELRRVAPMPRG